MAFNNRKKIDTPIGINNKLKYSNGIEIKAEVEDKILFHGRGLNEGFTEYLARKCSNINGREINYFFASLLIDIYGEQLLAYPLTNNPRIILDKRFKNIQEISFKLDLLEALVNLIFELGNQSSEELKKILTL